MQIAKEKNNRTLPNQRKPANPESTNARAFNTMDFGHFGGKTRNELPEKKNENPKVANISIRLNFNNDKTAADFVNCNALNRCCGCVNPGLALKDVNNDFFGFFKSTNKLGKSNVEDCLGSKTSSNNPIESMSTNECPSLLITDRVRTLQTTYTYVKTNDIGESVPATDSQLSSFDSEEKVDPKEARRFSTENFRIINPKPVDPSYEIKLFTDAYRVIRVFFKGKADDDCLAGLDRTSLIIVRKTIEKKFNIKINENDFNTKTLQNLLIKEEFNKRREECKKMVLGYAIKQLKKRLRESLDFHYRKDSFDEYFYNYYFAAAAEREGLSVSDFYYPIVSEKKRMGSAKTINKVYLSNIKKSDAFMLAFEEYLEKHFIVDYEKEIDSKLFELIFKFEAAYHSAADIECWTRTLQSHLALCKTKLPWTQLEIKEALIQVKKIMF